jgi:tetratricopeptide (TPR) repeat protein
MNSLLSRVRERFWGPASVPVQPEQVQAAQHVGEDPVLCERHRQQGNSLLAQGRVAEAIACYRQAVSADPRDADAHLNLGFGLSQLGQLSDAEAALQQAVALASGSADAWYVLATVRLSQGRLPDALPCLQRALSLNPELAPACRDLGYLHFQLKDMEAAERVLKDGIARCPEFAELHCNLGNVYAEQMDGSRALACYSRALALQPGDAQFIGNMGVAHELKLEFAEAERYYRESLRLNPAHADMHANLGGLLHRLGRLQEAMTSHEQALRLAPGQVLAHTNRGMGLLAQGRFAEGWAEYEWRWLTDDLRVHQRGFSQPLWLGKEPLRGKTLLVHAEQGLGDSLQFCRFVPQLADLGGQVLLEMPQQLLGLMGSLGGSQRLLCRGEPLPAFDFQCPLLSLPLALGITEAELAASARPYLQADPARTAVWRERLREKPAVRTGLVWSGRLDHGNDHNRSLALRDFMTALPKEIQFVSLQKEVRAADQALLDASPNILQVSDLLQDFADTAALIACLDLVISVDTSVAHLAGAMGKPVWLLLPYVPDWRWMLARDDSPWYPAMRLYRQPGLGQWAPVLARLRQDLLAAIPGDGE